MLNQEFHIWFYRVQVWSKLMQYQSIETIGVFFVVIYLQEIHTSQISLNCKRWIALKLYFVKGGKHFFCPNCLSVMSSKVCCFITLLLDTHLLELKLK